MPARPAGSLVFNYYTCRMYATHRADRPTPMTLIESCSCWYREPLISTSFISLVRARQLMRGWRIGASARSFCALASSALLILCIIIVNIISLKHSNNDTDQSIVLFSLPQEIPCVLTNTCTPQIKLTATQQQRCWYACRRRHLHSRQSSGILLHYSRQLLPRSDPRLTYATGPTHAFAKRKRKKRSRDAEIFGRLKTPNPTAQRATSDRFGLARLGRMLGASGPFLG